MPETVTFAECDDTAAQEESLFYEALMDEYGLATMEALASGQDYATIDAAIMQASLGVFDKASEYYSAESAQLLQLVDTISTRLEMLGCDHEHFLEAVSQRQSGDAGAAGAAEDGHDHHGTAAHGHTSKQQVKNKGNYKRGPVQQTKPVSIVLFELIMKYCGIQQPGNK